jgi:hypothetical protein
MSRDIEELTWSVRGSDQNARGTLVPLLAGQIYIRKERVTTASGGRGTRSHKEKGTTHRSTIVTYIRRREIGRWTRLATRLKRELSACRKPARLRTTNTR